MENIYTLLDELSNDLNFIEIKNLVDPNKKVSYEKLLAELSKNKLYL